jgi:hypothetical protein
MADTKITSLSGLVGIAVGDYLVIVDVSDTTMAASGTTKKVLISELQTFLDARYQGLDTDLTAIGALVSAADKFPYATGAGTWALTDLTAAARTVLDDTTVGAMRTTLGLAIGTDVQAYDAELAAIAGLTSAANKLPYFTGSGAAAVTDLTAAGRALIDDADATAQRTTLGLGSLATQAASAVAITGGAVTGITDLAVADGGTGASTAQAAAANLAVPYVLAQSAVAASVTGTTTETTLATITIPANALGANGRVRVTTVWSRNASGTGSNTPRVRFSGASGTIYHNAALSTANLGMKAQAEIANRGATNSQVGGPSGTPFGAAALGPVTSAVDTTASTTVVLTGQLANTGDTLTLESYLVELIAG